MSSVKFCFNSGGIVVCGWCVIEFPDSKAFTPLRGASYLLTKQSFHSPTASELPSHQAELPRSCAARVTCRTAGLSLPFGSELPSHQAELSFAYGERVTFSPSRAFIRLRRASYLLTKQSFHSPTASELLLVSPKSNQKAMRLSRCSDSHPANRNDPALLAAPGSLRQCIHALHRDRGDPSPRPVGPFPSRLRCSAPLDGASCLLFRPSLDYVFSDCEFWLLRQDAAKPGPLWGGERCEEKPEGAARGIAPIALPAQVRAVSATPTP